METNWRSTLNADPCATMAKAGSDPAKIVLNFTAPTLAGTYRFEMAIHGGTAQLIVFHGGRYNRVDGLCSYVCISSY